MQLNNTKDDKRAVLSVFPKKRSVTLHLEPTKNSVFPPLSPQGLPKAPPRSCLLCSECIKAEDNHHNQGKGCALFKS